MSAASHVLTDDSLLSRIDRTLLVLEEKFALLSGLAVLSLVFLAVASAGGRNLIDMPLMGYVDWIEQIMPLIAFMGISFCHREGGHIRMDLLIGFLNGRVQWLVEAITNLLVLLLITLLAWGSYAHFERSFDWNMPLWSRDSSIDIGLPLWPAKLLAPVAFAVLSLRLLIQIYAYSLAAIRGIEHPIAVPLPMSIEEQAEEEANQVSGRD